MKYRILSSIVLSGVVISSALSFSAEAATYVPPTKTMKAFASEQAFQLYISRLKKERARKQDKGASVVYSEANPVPPPAPAAVPMVMADAAVSASAPVANSSAKSKEEGITNNQTEGVDEGDIVKKRGDYLVVLRRGRLFTIKVNEKTLSPVSMVNAYAPDANPSGTWYDEMLISGNTIVVIGYSYERGGTEVGLFNISEQGVLKYRDTYQLRSNDYYSARNYASRLVGNKLIFYTPLSIDLYGGLSDHLPAMRHWRKGATPKDFKRILPATRIYRADYDINEYDMALHTVSICDLSLPEMSCRSSAVLGPNGRVFYVSEDSVYVWVTPWSFRAKKNNQSAIFRLPLSGAAPTALKASGSPIDQLSFLQRDGYLNVLVGSQSDGEGMWNSQSKAGELALLRVSLNSFGDGTTAARRADYRALPKLVENYGLQNRFVGDWLLYGAAYNRNKPEAFALRYKNFTPVQPLRLTHNVERIEVMGNDAIAVGMQGTDLRFTSIKLAAVATPVSIYTRKNTAQGDNRTHGFFYHPDTETQGIVGLPVLGMDGSNPTAAVMYLKNDHLKLGNLGQLDSKARSTVDDACKASCVDWYGNARPIFIGDRVYALMGYELVEGRLVSNQIKEVRRVNFTPKDFVEISE